MPVRDNKPLTGNFSKVLSWCKARHIKVELNYTGQNFREGSLISISGRLSEENKTIILLHECGHWLIDSHKNCNRFGAGYPVQHLRSKNKHFSYRSTIVFEELEAWKRGWDLAKRLKLTITKSAFEKQKNKVIKLYFKWAIAPKSFEKHA